MDVAVRKRLGRDLAECTIAIQGLGHVGESLARMLSAIGARLIVADPVSRKVDTLVDELNATAVAVNDIMTVDADVFAPCALGGILNDSSASTLKATVICGAANNQLLTSSVGDQLADRGILYAPDYVVNAGGIINVAAEHLGWSKEQALALLEETGKRLASVFDTAEQKRLPPHRAADVLARTLISGASATA